MFAAYNDLVSEKTAISLPSGSAPDTPDAAWLLPARGPMKNFAMKLKEAAVAVIPITALVLILNFALGGMPTLNLASFLVGAVLLIVGMALYTLGSSIFMEPAGEHIGAKVTATRKVWFILLVAVTVAEPDLTVLATQIGSIPNIVLIASVGAGVGVFMVIAVLRVLLKVRLNALLIALYAVVFVMAAFVAEGYVPLSFDSGGVTTGPITVPFILALGVGISGAVGGSHSQEDSFGMVGICSVGPILAVIILGLVYKSDAQAEVGALTAFGSFGDVLLTYLKTLPVYLEEVGIALAPIFAVFLFFQFTMLRLPAKTLLRMIIGAVYTYIGLTLFLSGVNVGFMQAGTFIGGAVAGVSRWLVIPIGAVIGSLIVLAEPAVHVLNRQVEQITGGAISRKNMLVVLVISMTVAVALSMLRVATGISIWWIIVPVYVIALALSFFVPKVFTAIAFDSGGVASGPMTATFLLPFAMGATAEIGGSIINDAFGTVAFVAMTPLVAVQVMGLVYKVKKTVSARAAAEQYRALLAREGEIIELD